MRVRAAVFISAFILFFSANSGAQSACRYIGTKTTLPKYEVGGPFVLDHFQLNKDRTDLREFLWKHWHDHVAGIADTKERNLDAGMPRELFIVQPDARGVWGVDIELKLPEIPQCVSFHADSLVRVPISQPDNDTYQTLGPNSDETLPNSRVPDAATLAGKFYWVILLANSSVIANAI